MTSASRKRDFPCWADTAKEQIENLHEMSLVQANGDIVSKYTIPLILKMDPGVYAMFISQNEPGEGRKAGCHLVLIFTMI